MATRVTVPFVDISIQNLPQNVTGQRTLATATDTSHTDETAQRETDINVLEIVVARSMHNDGVVGAVPAVIRDLNLQTTAEILSGQAAFVLHKFFE